MAHNDVQCKINTTKYLNFGAPHAISSQ